MFKYAQIEVATGLCTSVSILSSEVVDDRLIPLFEMVEQAEPDENGNRVFLPVTMEIVVNPRDTWDGTNWIPAPPIVPVDPGPSLEERYARLEAQLAQQSSDLQAVQEMILFPLP